MADNIAITPGSGAIAAADEVTFSGDTTKLQIVRPAYVTGSEGSKTVVDQATGAGAVNTGTQRTTLGSDDPAVVALQIMDDWDNAASDGASVSGDVAHDAVDAGEPVKIGAIATASLNGGTNVSASDRTNLKAGLDGALIVRDGSLEDIATATPIAITDGSSTSLIAAQGAGVKTYITDITICNTSATAVTVDLRDGAAGAVKWTFPVPAGGGVTHSFRRPIAFSANTAVCADPSASASTITVSANGFKSKI